MRKELLFLAYLGLLFLATPLSASWPVKISFWLFCLVLYWLLGPKEDFQFSNASWRFNLQFKTWLFLLPSAILIISRLLPFFHWGEFALGADAATYLMQLPAALPDWSFYAVYIVVNLLVGLGVYFISRQYFGQEAALFSFFIFSISVSQFLAYWLVYGKMMAAIVLTLAGFYFLKKDSWLAVPTAILIGLVHPPSLLPFLILLLFSGRFLFLLIAVGFAFILNWEQLLGYLYYSSQYFSGNYPLILEQLLTGHFVEVEFYQNFLALIYLPFALLGFVRLLAAKNFNHLFFYALANFLIIALNFFFRNRYLILLDLSLIMLAGPVLRDFFQWLARSRFGQLAAVIAIVVVIINIFYQSWRIEPLVNAMELTEIKTLADLEPAAKIVSGNYLYSSALKNYSRRQVIELEELPDYKDQPLYLYLGRRTKKEVIHRQLLRLKSRHEIIKIPSKYGEIYRLAPR